MSGRQGRRKAHRQECLCPQERARYRSGKVKDTTLPDLVRTLSPDGYLATFRTATLLVGRSGGCDGDFGFGEHRDDAELLHHAQSVPVNPALYHFARGEADGAGSGDRE